MDSVGNTKINSQFSKNRATSIVPEMNQLPKYTQLPCGGAAPLDFDKGVESIRRPSVQWMGCNNKDMGKAQRASKGGSTRQRVAFWLMWLFEQRSPQSYRHMQMLNAVSKRIRPSSKDASWRSHT